MSDLVLWLRANARWATEPNPFRQGDHAGCAEMWNKSADEIERLRADVKRLETMNRIDCEMSEACCQCQDLRAEVERRRADAERMRKGIAAVGALIDESHGVYGLHLNGDGAPWSELLTGGRFEEWLIDFDEARAAAMKEAGR